MPTTTLNPVYNSGDSNDGSRAVDNALYAGNSGVTTKQFGAKGELVMKLKVGLGLSGSRLVGCSPLCFLSCCWSSSARTAT